MPLPPHLPRSVGNTSPAHFAWCSPGSSLPMCTWSYTPQPAPKPQQDPALLAQASPHAVAALLAAGIAIVPSWLCSSPLTLHWSACASHRCASVPGPSRLEQLFLELALSQAPQEQPLTTSPEGLGGQVKMQPPRPEGHWLDFRAALQPCMFVPAMPRPVPQTGCDTSPCYCAGQQALAPSPQPERRHSRLGARSPVGSRAPPGPAESAQS
ncbi:coatomer subunit beta' [Platysternon megacephalum]|uniref:Coatomer subunit beta n=1 Tax=Platysternon megacephalum TaxID=55544 RepID=A0A4D9DZR4_9SAUR|nr:coatomer subunit beta' [Platysternon megacephalum]